ncbi:MAG TPA: class I SAM-dependent methyltransferase [Tepidisphaeraceae bacterium]|jgi:SAM-dependent methyltransferase/methyltransferase-like protein
MDLRQSYDDVTYESLPFPQSHPDRLFVVSNLLGFTPAPVQTARVLELGCATGANLLAMADVLPDAHFLGIDLSPKQIEIGNQFVRSLNLLNIQFQAIDLQHLAADAGQFDYIIAHGLYSWVPDDVRRRLMQLIKQHLSPTGVAYISYNTFPGWRIKQISREIMLYHTRHITDPRQRLTAAQQFLSQVAGALPTESSAYARALHDEANFLAQQQPYYLAHDHLESINHPVYFHQFVENAAQHGLQYIAEATLSSMTGLELPAATQEALRRLPIKDPIEAQQYLDFLAHRSFRQSIVTHAGAKILATPDPALIKDFYISANIKLPPDFDISSSAPSTLKVFNGIEFDIAEPLYKALFAELAEGFPLHLHFDDLIARAQQRVPVAAPGLAEEQIKGITAFLLQCYLHQIIDLYPRQPDFITTVSDRPTARPLARAQAQHSNRVVNYLHQSVNLDEAARQFLLQLDGREWSTPDAAAASALKQLAAASLFCA